MVSSGQGANAENNALISQQGSFRSFGLVDGAKVEIDYTGGFNNNIRQNKENSQVFNRSRQVPLHSAQSLVLAFNEVNSEHSDDEQVENDGDDKMNCSNDFELLSGHEIAATRANSKAQLNVEILIKKEEIRTPDEKNESSMLLKNQPVVVEADGSF